MLGLTHTTVVAPRFVYIVTLVLETPGSLYKYAVNTCDDAVRVSSCHQIFVMKEGHHKVFTLFGGTKILTCSSQVRRSRLSPVRNMVGKRSFLLVHSV